MRFETMRVFLSVVETGSLAAASREQHLSQPAVSMIINSLEDELSQKLILRRSGQRKPLEITSAGFLFAEYCRKTLNDYQQMIRAIALAGENLEPFILGTSPTPSSRILPVLSNQFKREFPDVPFYVRTFGSSTVHNKLSIGECDIAITSTAPTDPLFSYQRFFFDPLVLIAPKSMELKNSITISQLKKLPIIVRENCNVMRIITDALDEQKVCLSEMNVALQVFGNPAVKQAVILGAGVGFVTLSEVTDTSDCNVVSVRGLNTDRYLYLMRRINAPFTSAMKVFWEFTTDSRWRKDAFPFSSSV
jgi:DNA-binding transcriptional LysR family regulator